MSEQPEPHGPIKVAFILLNFNDGKLRKSTVKEILEDFRLDKI